MALRASLYAIRVGLSCSVSRKSSGRRCRHRNSSDKQRTGQHMGSVHSRCPLLHTVYGNPNAEGRQRHSSSALYVATEALGGAGTSPLTTPWNDSNRTKPPYHLACPAQTSFGPLCLAGIDTVEGSRPQRRAAGYTAYSVTGERLTEAA